MKKIGSTNLTLTVLSFVFGIFFALCGIALPLIAPDDSADIPGLVLLCIGGVWFVLALILLIVNKDKNIYISDSGELLVSTKIHLEISDGLQIKNDGKYYSIPLNKIKDVTYYVMQPGTASKTGGILGGAAGFAIGAAMDSNGKSKFNVTIELENGSIRMKKVYNAKATCQAIKKCLIS
ncbi:MAG: hypothetical protein PHX51_07835 [Clostridia bacterium]|nr:hypothetical protein [Clostridia bacterium]